MADQPAAPVRPATAAAATGATASPRLAPQSTADAPTEPPSAPLSAAEERLLQTQRALNAKRLEIAQRHSKRLQHQGEHNKDPAWYRHSKHVLILSYSGRPVWSRYGDESALAAYVGVLSALVSNFERLGDTLRAIRAGPWQFVFLFKGPLYLVAISRTRETVQQLSLQLAHVHRQVMSTLTSGINHALEARPSYDVRNLLGGTENLLGDIVTEASHSPAYLLNAVPCLRLNRTVRAKVGAMLKKARTRNTLYALLLAGSQVVNLAQSRERALGAPDLLLLINLLTNSESLRTAESWTPVCLPGFNDQGFLYAYVCFLTADLCLALVTSNSDEFHDLRLAKVELAEALEKSDCLSEITKAIASRHILVSELHTSVPEFRHFMFKSESTSQLVVSVPAPPYDTQPMMKALIERYQHVHARLMGGKKPHTIYYEVNEFVALLAWYRRDEFQLYAAFTPLVSKEAATTACNRAVRWLKQEEDSLFPQW